MSSGARRRHVDAARGFRGGLTMTDSRAEHGIIHPRRVLAATLLLALPVLAAWWFVKAWHPGPPRVMRMATGPAGSAYADFGARYREIFARAGVTLELEPTAGALANLGRLRDPQSGVGAGFVQAGTTTPEESPDLFSLGTVFYEPLWLFHRLASSSREYSDLRGKRISIGSEGSATRALSLRLLALGGIDASAAELLAFDPEEAADRLTRGEIDAAVFLTSWSSQIVQRLLHTRGITVASFPRADALIALFPVLNKRVLPAGVADLGRNIPPTDVVLVAPKASLVVRRDLHPALRYLLLDAAAQIHTTPGIFHHAGEFPALEALDLPLAPDAEQFHKSGLPFFQRHLPFWVAVVAERMAIVLVPVVGILFPLLRGLPAARDWYVHRRVAMLYGELKLLELEVERLGAQAAGPDVIKKLEELEARVSHLRVPEVYSVLAYTLRAHIRLVQSRLKRPLENV
jgi:TRAP-type uncharacterized transport system substrate-binding protein